MYTKLNVLGLLLISASATAGVGEWTSSGPYGGLVEKLAINPETPTTMLAITNGTVARSIDGAASWQIVNDSALAGLGGNFVFDTDLDLVYAVNFRGLVLRSNDQGETWAPTGYNLPTLSASNSYSNMSLADVPGSGKMLLALAQQQLDPLLTTPMLFSSTDAGATFTPMSNASGLPIGEPIRDALALDTNGMTLLASVGDFATVALEPIHPSVYRSTDGGLNWVPVLTLTGNVDVQPETTLYRGAGSSVMALVSSVPYFSANDGVSFTQLTPTVGSASLSLNVLAMDRTNPNRFFAAGGVAGGGFSDCTISVPNYTCTPVTGTRISPNLGYTMANGLESLAGRIQTMQGDATGAIWVGTVGLGVTRLSFVAGSWVAEQFNQGLSGVNVRAILIHPNPSTISGGQHRRLYAGFGDRTDESVGIYLSTNGATTWAPGNNGLRLVGIRDLVIDPTTAGIGQPAGSVPISASTMYATGSSSRVTVPGVSGQPYLSSPINRSTDGGSTWQPIGNGLPTVQTVISGVPYQVVSAGTSRGLALDPRSCAAPPVSGPCTTGPLTTGIAGTDGRLNTSFVALPPFANVQLVESRLVKSTNLSAATAAASVLWTDIGQPSSGFAPSFNATQGIQRITPVQILFDPQNSNIVYVSTFAQVIPNPPSLLDPHNGVFKSTDGGLNWTPATNGLPTVVGHTNRKLDVLALAINPQNPQVLWAAVLDAFAEGAGTSTIPLYKTIDGGANWLPSSTGIPARFDIRALTVDQGDPNVLYAAGYNQDTVTNPGGIYKSEDAGATWRSISIGLPATSATAIEIDPVNPSTVHVGTRVGLWSLTQVPDADGDGAPDATENGIQGGDGNGDGVQDSIQGDVGSTGVALRRPAKGLGGSNVTIDLFQSVSASNPNNPCTQNVDVSGQLALQFGRDYWNGTNLYYGYPDDVVQFEIVDCESAIVDITYHSENFNEYGWSFRFYGPGMPGDSSNVKWWDFNSRAVKLNSKTWRVTLDNDEFGSYRPPASNLIRFIGGPACFDDRLHVNGFEDAAPLTPPACN